MLVLPMPERGIATQEMEPERADAMAPERNGRQGGVTLGEPLWAARWTLSRSLTQGASDEWRAFMVRLRGSARGFIAHDRDRLFPAAHTGGFARMTRVDGSAFTGAAGGWAQMIDADGNAMLSLTNVPSGLRLGIGDYIGFRWDAAGSSTGSDDRRAMVRLVQPARGDHTGAVTCMVEPPVPIRVVPAGAVAHLDRPACLMKLVPGESSLAALDRRQKIGGGTIVALQDLRA